MVPIQMELQSEVWLDIFSWSSTLNLLSMILRKVDVTTGRGGTQDRSSFVIKKQEEPVVHIFPQQIFVEKKYYGFWTTSLPDKMGGVCGWEMRIQGFGNGDESYSIA